MKASYKRRPQDFKRRIIKKIFIKEDLIIEEQKWLDQIKPEECGIRYYNKTLRSNTPSMRGKKHSVESKQKIGKSNKGKIRSEEFKDVLRKSAIKQFSDQKMREKRSETMKSFWKTNREKYLIGIQKTASVLKGITRPIEVCEKISKSNKGKIRSEEFRKKMSFINTGKKQSETTKEKHRKNMTSNEHSAKTYLITHPCGKQEIISNLSKFCRENNLSSIGFWRMLRGINTTKNLGYKIVKGDF